MKKDQTILIARSQTQTTDYKIDPLNIDVSSVTKVLSYEYAKQHGLLPLKVDSASITIATKEPISSTLKQELSRLLLKEIHLVSAKPQEIDRYQHEFYHLANSANYSQSKSDDSKISSANPDQLISSSTTNIEDQHIIQVVEWLLQYAFEQRASDIHIEPRHDRGEIRFRIDGILHQAHHVPPSVLLAINSRLKTMGKMDISEKRRPLDGRLKTLISDSNEVELRLSTIPTPLGEKMVIRIFDPTVLQRSFAELGLDADQLALWKKATKNKHGILLVTGPTGSGKTTTLYSTLRQLATSEVNVCTIEDPIEMIEPKFNQIQVHPAIHLTFAAGIRALLRQDPDIIMVGEIRDLETAEIAIQAALTGHLVLSTLHTNDAPSAITRLLELGMPAYLVNATVLGVMAQRLIRTLCPHCKTPVKIDSQIWQDFTDKHRIENISTYQANGCDVCRQTGYLGRIGLYEMMSVSDELKSLTVANADLQAIYKQVNQDGMLNLRHSGINKVAAGLTTIDEVIRVAPQIE